MLKNTTIPPIQRRRLVCKYLRSEVEEEEHWLAAAMIVGDRVFLSLALEKLP